MEVIRVCNIQKHMKIGVCDVFLLLEGADDIVSGLIDICSLSWMSSQFYVNALKQVVKNRQILKFSYVFGYYRPLLLPFVNKNIFENLQRDLERHSEMLSNLVETKTLKILSSESQNILNQTKVADKLMESLLNAAGDWTHPIEDKGSRRKQRKISTTTEKEKVKGKKDRKLGNSRNRIVLENHEGEKEEDEYNAEDDDDEDIRRRHLENNERAKLDQEREKEQELYKQRDKERERRDRQQREEEDFRKAIELSKKDSPFSSSSSSSSSVQNNKGNFATDDDWELQVAIQASRNS